MIETSDRSSSSRAAIADLSWRHIEVSAVWQGELPLLTSPDVGEVPQQVVILPGGRVQCTTEVVDALNRAHPLIDHPFEAACTPPPIDSAHVPRQLHLAQALRGQSSCKRGGAMSGPRMEA